jgi:hypothetical protein
MVHALMRFSSGTGVKGFSKIGSAAIQRVAAKRRRSDTGPGNFHAFQVCWGEIIAAGQQGQSAGACQSIGEAVAVVQCGAVATRAEASPCCAVGFGPRLVERDHLDLTTI